MRLFLALLLLLSSTCASYADTPKIFIGNVPYTGPSRVEGAEVWVDVDKLAQATGWQVDRHGDFVCLHHPKAPVAHADTGFFINDRACTGMKTEGTTTWVSLQDLAHTLGGQAAYQQSLNLVQCTLPGMPASNQPDPRVTLIAQLKLAPYTLVYYMLSTDVYCQRFTPIVHSFSTSHTRTMRLVEVDLAHQGGNWIYDTFKTRSNGIPELVLLDSEGHILQKLLGETDTKTLEKELTPLLK